MARKTATDKMNGEGFLTTRIDELVKWGRKNSIWPMPFGTACCGIEMMAVLGPKFDLARFGAEAIRFSPRQSDMLIVAGRVSIKMMPVLQRIYEQMPEPKWVVSMGACASCGGVFNTYTLIQGIDQFIPVDVYVSGCPPRPEALIDAVMEIQRIIEQGEDAVFAFKLGKKKIEVGPPPADDSIYARETKGLHLPVMR